MLLEDFSVRDEQVVLGSIIIAGLISSLILVLFSILRLSAIFYLIPGVLFLFITFFLIQYFPSYYQKKSDEIEMVFPLIRSCIELFLSFIPQTSDISVFLVHFLASIPSPIQKTFQEKQRLVQEGRNPEKILQQYHSPSKNLENYIKNLQNSLSA